MTRTKDISVKKALEDCAVWVKILERDINFDTDSISDACVVTAKAKITGEDEIERTKIDGYVVKPVSASTLLAQIRSSRKE